MRIKSLFDKAGLGSIGFGMDGLFIHSDLTKWMDELSPVFLFLTIKIASIFLGAYLIYVYNNSINADQAELEKGARLKKRIALAKKIGRYHWYLLIILCFLSASMNWGNEPGSGLGIAFFMLLFWLLVVWPTVYFWKKNYTDPSNIVDLNNLRDRNELLKFIFIEANRQYKKIMNIFLALCLVLPILCALYPPLVGEEESGEAYASCLVILLFITLILWVMGLVNKRKNNKIKSYYFANPDCKIWAAEESENTLHIKFNDKEIEIGIIFLPLPVEECVQILNYGNRQHGMEEANEPTQKLGLETPSQQKTEPDPVTSIAIESIETYKSKQTYNIPALIFYSMAVLPIGALLSFIYAYLIWYIPPYFNIIITAVFGVLIGFLFPIKLSKCTNTKVAIISILLFAFLCHWFGWATWMDLFINRGDVIKIDHPKSPISAIVPSSSNLDQILYLITNPGVLLDHISFTGSNTYISIFTIKISGFGLYFIWLCELVIVLYFSSFTSSERSNEPFSTVKNKWLNSLKVKQNHITDIDLLERALQNGELGFFQNLQPAQKDESYSELEVWHLENEQAYISIKNHTKVADDRGRIKFKETELVKYAKINKDVVPLILRIAAEGDSTSSKK